jgi:anti-anti-sigma factor
MKIQREDRGPITILHLQGTLTGGPDSELFDRTVEELIGESRLYVVLDFDRVNFVGSPAIGFIARNYAHHVRAGGEIVAACIGTRVALVFDLFLRRLFQCFDSVDEAVEFYAKRTMKGEG